MSEASCPNCGQPVEPRQLVCLHCGGRIALRERTALAREPASALAAVLLSVIVIGAALFGFAISELTHGDGGGDGGGSSASEQAGPAAPDARGGQAQAPTAGGGQPEGTEAHGAEPDAPAVVAGEQQGPVPRETGVPGWPKGLAAHTVVLVTSSDRAAALNVAREARGSGLEAGLLPSDPYDLGTGLWIVYSGQFTTREGAARQATHLAGRYPGAYPQLIQRSQ